MVALRSAGLLAAAIAVTSVQAAYKGFNAGPTNLDGSTRTQADFEAQFRASASLPGTNGEWTSARLYTMIEQDTAKNVSLAIPAAIATNTSLLLGMWASSGDDAFKGELAALEAAISQYGNRLGNLTIGIAVGSEDIYRTTPEGISKNLGEGASADTIVRYIGQVRKAIQGSALDGVPVGHIEMQAAWSNSTSAPVVFASDFLGLDFYPYYLSNGTNNAVQTSGRIFFDAYDSTTTIAGGKPVWVTETGWPVTGPQIYQATASVNNAETYWSQVQCQLDSMDVNTFWFTLDDSTSGNPTSFNILEEGPGSKPRYDLSCTPGNSTGTSTPGASSGSATDSGSSTELASPGMGGTADQGLSVGAKAAIGTVIPILVLLLGAAAFYLFFLRRRRQRSKSLSDSTTGLDGKPELDAAREIRPEILVEAGHVEVQELDSSEVKKPAIELPQTYQPSELDGEKRDYAELIGTRR